MTFLLSAMTLDKDRKLLSKLEIGHSSPKSSNSTVHDALRAGWKDWENKRRVNILYLANVKKRAGPRNSQLYSRSAIADAKKDVKGAKRTAHKFYKAYEQSRLMRDAIQYMKLHEDISTVTASESKMFGRELTKMSKKARKRLTGRDKQKQTQKTLKKFDRMKANLDMDNCVLDAFNDLSISDEEGEEEDDDDDDNDDYDEDEGQEYHLDTRVIKRPHSHNPTQPPSRKCTIEDSLHLPSPPQSHTTCMSIADVNDITHTSEETSKIELEPHDVNRNQNLRDELSQL